MNKEEWLKAIKCTKEELIEWLNEMYENEKIIKEILRKYEKISNAGIRTETIKTNDIATGKEKIYIKEIVSAEINGEKIEYYEMR